MNSEVGKTNFEMAWERVKQITGWAKYKDLAAFVDSSTESIAGVKKRGKFNLEWAHKIAVEFGSYTDYIMDGVAPKMRGEADQPQEDKARRYVLDPSAELMAQVQERLNACIAKYGVTLPVEKTINLTMTSMRIFDGNYKDREFRELVMDSVIDNLVKLALPEK